VSFERSVRGLTRIFSFVIIFTVLLVAGPARPAGAAQEIAPLLEQARVAGTVSVIVELALPGYRPEAELPGPAAVHSQRQAIATRQQALLDGLPVQAMPGYRYRSLPYFSLSADEETLAYLLASPLVAGIQRDQPEAPTLDSSMPVIGAPDVWAEGYEGTGEVVVVLDTGIDPHHAFFSDGGSGSRIVYQACFSNAGGVGGETSLCLGGGNSEFGGNAASARITTPDANSDCADGSRNICSHGTHVAGIVAGSDSGTLHGVARGASIIAIQVFTRFDDCGPCALSYVSDQLAALDYVNTTLRNSYNIVAVNMSLGGVTYTDQETCDSSSGGRKPAIDNLRGHDIATIIAAGNDGYRDAISIPGCISSAIGVSSTTDDDQISSFSNMDEMVDLLAPGSGIYSAVPDGGFAFYDGTSMATPAVAGAWALLADVAPALTVDERLALLQSTGVSVSDGRSGGIHSKPRIQVDDAVTALLGLNLLVDTTTDSNDAAYQVCADAGANDCSLRGAISKVNASPAGDHSIQVPAGTYTLSLSGAGEDTNATGDLDVAADVTISGDGARSTFVDGNSLDRVFHVAGEHSVTLNDLTVAGGLTSAPNAAGAGGGILNEGGTLTVNRSRVGNNESGKGDGGGLANMGGTLTIAGSTVDGNSADNGGGIANLGLNGNATLQLSNSTITANSASDGGGGIANRSDDADALVTLNNVTVAGNTAGDGGGLDNQDLNGTATATTVFGNTIVAGNSANTAGSADCFDGVTVQDDISSNGHNLVGSGSGCPSDGAGDQTTAAASGEVSTLADNGGPTDTMALPIGSMAVNGGDPATCEATGQRVVARPQDGACDTGAYELWRPAITAVSATDASLSWEDASGGCTYGVYESTSPTFTPAGNPTYEPVTSPYPLAGRLGTVGTNYFFINRATCDGEAIYSSMVGEFDFALVPGD